MHENYSYNYSTRKEIGRQSFASLPTCIKQLYIHKILTVKKFHKKVWDNEWNCCDDISFIDQ